MIITDLKKPIIQACMKGNMKSLRTILLSGASPTILPRFFSQSSEFFSLRVFGNTSSQPTLTVDPKNLNAVFPGLGLTLLHLSCYKSQDAVAMALLNAGADVNITDEVTVFL